MVKAWGIVYEGKLLEASTNKKAAQIEKARAQAHHAIILTIIPCIISYTLPKKGKKK